MTVGHVFLQRTVKTDISVRNETCRPQGGPKSKPNAVGSIWKGGARERADDVFLCRGHKKTSEQSGLCSDVVPVVGLEPTRSHLRKILSLVRLPFRHAGLFCFRIARTIDILSYHVINCKQFYFNICWYHIKNFIQCYFNICWYHAKNFIQWYFLIVAKKSEGSR